MKILGRLALILVTLKPHVSYMLVTTFVSMRSVLLNLLLIAATLWNLIHSEMVWKYGLPLTQNMSTNRQTLLYCAMMGARICTAW
jgi:hypothetical protein